MDDKRKSRRMVIAGPVKGQILKQGKGKSTLNARNGAKAVRACAIRALDENLRSSDPVLIEIGINIKNASAQRATLQVLGDRHHPSANGSESLTRPCAPGERLPPSGEVSGWVLSWQCSRCSVRAGWQGDRSLRCVAGLA